MWDLNYFTYRKDPIARIKTIGVYPLDDEGKTKYYSKESYTHKYLRKTDPNLLNEIIKECQAGNTQVENDEESKKASNLKANIGVSKNLTIDKEMKNQIIINNGILNKSTLGNYKQNQTLDCSSMRKKNKVIKNLRGNSYSNNFCVTSSNQDLKQNISKTINDLNNYRNRKLAQSMDKKRRINIGLKIVQKEKDRTYKNILPSIMRKTSRAGNGQIISFINTISSKEMGETYNPYAFLSPPINRTKRNYVGGLFHC